MDNQVPSPNTPTPTERSTGAVPEAAPKQEAAQAVPVEVSPAAGAAPAAANAAAPAASKLTAADVAAAIAATPTPGAPASAATSTPTPAVAEDVDLIEPEWVEKASEVVKAHAGDPYGEEEAIEELQVDYLQKRYGISVSDPDADSTKPKGA